MGIIDKESAMNLALGVTTTNSSEEERVSLMPLGDIEDSKKELERLRGIMELQAAQLRASAEGEITRIQEWTYCV